MVLSSLRGTLTICCHRCVTRDAPILYCQVEAVDIDEGLNAKVAYGLVSNSRYSATDMFQIESDLGTISLASDLTKRDINVTHHVTITATDAGTRQMSSSIDLCIQITDRTVENQLRPVMRQDTSLLGQLTTNYTILAGVIALSVIGTISILLSLFCLVRRSDARRRHGFKQPPHIDETHSDRGLGQGQYNCRVAALCAAKGDRRNGRKHSLGDDGEWTELDQRLALKSAGQCDVTDCKECTVIRTLESSPRRQANGSFKPDWVPACRSNARSLATAECATSKHNANNHRDNQQQQQRYQVIL